MPGIQGQLLWSTPIIEVVNPDHAAIKEGLVRHIKEMENRDGGAISSGVAVGAKNALYESKFNFFRSDNPQVQQLHTFCRNSLRESLIALDQQFNKGVNNLATATVHLHESWAHVTYDGGAHDVHLHTNCSWCGIYHVENGDATLDPPNGINRFYPPITTTYEDRGTSVIPLGMVGVRPQEGRLVLFPSFITHSATVYRGKRDRIVVAFNARVI